MWGAGLASHVTPLSGVEVNVLPLRLAQLTGAHEDQRGKSESAHYDERSLIAIQNSQKLTHARGLSNRCKMVALYRGKGASQIAGRISLSSTGGNGITEYPSAVAQRSMCSVKRATAFNATYHGEQFGGGNAGNWPSTDPWKKVTFKAGYEAITMTWRPAGREFFKPFAGDDFKAVCSTPSSCCLHGFALLAWVNIIDQQLARFITPLACYLETHIRIDAER